MSVSEHFARFVLPLSSKLWRVSARTRGRLFHGTGRCPQRQDPFAPGLRDVLCADCTEYHHWVLIAADKRIARRLRQGRSAALAAVEAHVHAVRDSIMLDARDLHDHERGFATRLKRIPERSGWFVQAVPDELDRELVIDVLYFVRGGDRLVGGKPPIASFAQRYGIDEAECDERFERAIEGLRARKPKWVQDNFERPMSERLAEGGAVDFSEVVEFVRQEAS